MTRRYFTVSVPGIRLLRPSYAEKTETDDGKEKTELDFVDNK